MDLEFDPEIWLETVDYIIKIYTQQEVPSVGDTIESYLTNQIDEKTYKCWLRLNGANPDTFNGVLWARREKLRPHEYIEYQRRNKTDDDTITKALRYYGFIDDGEAKAAMEMFDELPTISDHLHWLQRNVFDDEYVKDYDLLNGFEERFWVKFGGDLRARGMKKDYAKLHYAAHWIQPAMGQLFQMLARNRPGRVDPSIQFTEEDLLRLMAEQDVAPYFRQRLRNIAYQPITLRFLRQMFDMGVISDADAVERYQDLSYAPTDAELLVKTDSIRRIRTNTTATKGSTPTKIRQLYILGSLDKFASTKLLKDQGFPDDAISKAIATWDTEKLAKEQAAGDKESKSITRKATLSGLRVGTVSPETAMAQLVRLGDTQNHAADSVRGVQAEEAISLARQAIGVIRKAALKGRVTLGQASTMLSGLGIVPDKVSTYLQLWNLEMQAGMKQLSAQDIIKKSCEGLIPLDEAQQRLLNLGYDDADAALKFAEIQQCVTKNEAKMADAQNKADARQAKQLMQLQKQIAQQSAQLVKQLEKSAGKADLLKWYVDGVIGRTYLITRLIAIGVTPSDAEIAALDADVKRSANSAKQAKKSGGGSVGSGSTASTGGAATTSGP